MGVTLAEATRVFARIGLLSFGGPAAQIALMHRELVEDRNWLEEREYLGALSFCMLLPGPEAMQLATYAGWKLHGIRGGLIAGLLFVLPGAAVVMALAAAYVAFGGAPAMAALFFGIKAAVVVIVIEALLRVGRKALAGTASWVIAGASFVAIFFLAVPFPAIVAAAAVVGAVALRGGGATAAPTVQPRLGATLGTIATWGALWWAPVAALALAGSDFLVRVGLFFSWLAVATFGGAYAVLAWMAQEAVTGQGWLTAGQMMDGLGLAETTPGPLILVTEFVGFLGGFGAGGWPMAVAAALLTLWVTFAPCFLWIFAGAPYVAWITAQPVLRAALGGITAAVVGVIANLTLWFALHVFFADVTQTWVGPVRLWLPDLATFAPLAVVLAAIAGWLMLVRHTGLAVVLPLMGVAGVALGMAGLV